MPPAILGDSDDDEDEVLFDDGGHGSLSRSNGEGPAGISGLDGTNDQSTGSTERLKRQLYDAHLNLCVDSGEQAHSSLGNNTAQASPSIQLSKRRHTGVTSAAAAVYSPEKVKRTKTLKTYSSKKSSSAAKAERPTPHEDLLNPGTSQSAKFSEHLGMQQSSGLPLGSIQAGSINHEPAVMFRESGSTVPDNESSHERMIEEAIRSKSAKSTSTIKLVNSDEPHKSSSFPWSASEQTESAKSPRTNNISASAGMTQARAIAENGGMAEVPGRGEPDGDVPLTALAGLEGHHALDNSKNSLTTIEKTKSSPAVVINVSELPTTSPGEDALRSTGKSNRGRKRKAQQEPSEPLNSEDIAVGLPKERYQPRPSRRRTTQVLEDPIDYSIAPEKAAKKRRKTASASFEASTEPDVSAVSPMPAPAARTSKLQRIQKPATVNDVPEKPDADISPGEKLDNAEVQQVTPQPKSAVVPEGDKKEAGTIQKTDEKKPAQPTSQPSSQLRSDDVIFLKSAPKQKSASKSKRSHTTIFEDHVDFTGNVRSPSLSQQQAKRKLALKDVKNEPSSVKPRRGTKHVLPSDDEDEEDELAFHEEEDEANEPPKKRGRGRPAKVAAKTVPKASKTVVEAEDAPKDESEVVTPDELPKKRGRGRPPKATLAPLEDPVDQENAKEPTTVQKPVVTEPNPDTPAQKSSAAEMPTPSPDPQKLTNEVATPQKPAKTGPTAHSPIKSSSIVPHRVGLSKRSRIPSLLKVMRPPPKR